MERSLELEPEITISRLHGEDIDACVELLDYVMTIGHNRGRYLASRNERAWTGERSVVVIVPSSEVLEDHRALDLVHLLVRTGRAYGIDLRLFDATPPLGEIVDGRGQLVYPLSAFGSTIVRTYAADPDIAHVTFHQLSPREMVELTENA